MKLRDILEGYFAIRELNKKGFFEDDNLRLGDYIRLCAKAESKVKGVDVDEDK